jgi:two-component system, NtrC family, sensor kinase
MPIPMEVGKLVGDVVTMSGRSAALRRVRLVYNQLSAIIICGFPGQLSQVLSNLIRNAAEAAPPDTEVSVRAALIHRGGCPGARITIHDRGSGIPENIRENLFDPFFTTKGLKGSGLGLWVSRTLVMRHHWKIRFRSSCRLGASGTTFEVFLPTETPAVEA